MATFKVGDEVQMRDGSAVWSQYPLLHLARGRVTGTTPGTNEAQRISVQFPDGTTLAGVSADMFKPAGS